MREIKFRAWNKGIGWKNKDGSPYEPKMECKGFILYPRTGLCEFPQGGWDIGGYTENPESFILMQYTGLKDKNGNEIYEGDIVRNNDIEWVVDWNDGAVYMKQIGKEHNTWWIGGEHQYCEVIGNIYENPELLVKK